MDIIFMNSENEKTCDPYRLVYNLANKMDLDRSEKLVALSNLNFYSTWKTIKMLYKNNKSITFAQNGTKNFYYLMDLILFQIFQIILSISSRNMTN